MTRYEQIKQMSLEDIAEKAVTMFGSLTITNCAVSCLDMTVHKSREEVVEHNRQWLESEVKEN